MAQTNRDFSRVTGTGGGFLILSPGETYEAGDMGNDDGAYGFVVSNHVVLGALHQNGHALAGNYLTGGNHGYRPGIIYPAKGLFTFIDNSIQSTGDVIVYLEPYV